MNVSHDTLATILRWAYAPSERAATDAIVELAEARRREQQMSRPEAHQWRDDDAPRRIAIFHEPGCPFAVLNEEGAS